MKLIAELSLNRDKAKKALGDLETTLTNLYNTHPSLFPKRPNEMSISDKMRFSEDLINFVEVIDQYK